MEMIKVTNNLIQMIGRTYIGRRNKKAKEETSTDGKDFWFGRLGRLGQVEGFVGLIG